MFSLAHAVAKFISKEHLLRPGDRVGLAVSGGADSVALLRLMMELRPQLGIVVSVLHFNHKLRGEDAEADERFVRELSQRSDLDFFCGFGNADAYGKEKHLSLEAAARSLRYEFFLRTMQEARLSSIATAHTLDDQAETVLLKLVRGAGTRGIGGVYQKLIIVPSQPNCKPDRTIIRPLLGVRRRDIEIYLQGRNQTWREDKSNRDLRHSRNVVRHGILPRFERNLNPSVREALAETADIAREEESYWVARIAELMPTAMTPQRSLDRHFVLAQPLAVQRRLVRAFAETLGFRLEFRHVQEILHSASESSSPRIMILPGGWRAKIVDSEIRFKMESWASFSNYDYELRIPGRIEVPEAGSVFEALLVGTGAESAYNPDDAMDGSLLVKTLRVRNWRAGERFRPAHSKSPKKIKELLQQVHLRGADRKLVPVVVSGDEVVWLRGFQSPVALRGPEPSRAAIVIRETMIQQTLISK